MAGSSDLTGGGASSANIGSATGMADGAMAALGRGLDGESRGRGVDPQEVADVREWWRKIYEARDFDAPARRQYAKDRKYARGDSGFPVDTNLVGTFIDILFSFLYARDPDVETQPAPSVEPPSLDALMDAAMDAVAGDPRVAEAASGARAAAVQKNHEMAMSQVGQAAIAHGVVGSPGMPPSIGPGAGAGPGGGPGPLPNPSAMYDPDVAAKAAAQAKQQEIAQEQFQQMRRSYEKAQRQNKAFADTLDIVIQRLWFDARLKKRGRRVTRSALTVGPGWFKASWQTRTAPDPQVAEQMNDLKAMMERAAANKADIEDSGSPNDVQAQTAEYERQLAALQAKSLQIIARGFVADFVEAENMIVPQDCGPLTEYLDSPWLGDRWFLRRSEAMAQFGLSADDMKGVVAYYERPPVLHNAESGTMATGMDADDAERFTTSAPATGSASGAMTDTGSGLVGGIGRAEKDYFVHGVEIWDQDSGSVLTTIEGVKRWVKPAWQPKETTRWYPYFMYAMSEIDGQRHPQSMTSRLTKLADEYNSVRTGYKEHRQRARPKTWFNSGMLDVATVTKLSNGTTAEWIGVNPTIPGTPLTELMGSVAYPPMDAALYDTKPVMSEMERISGVQEALSQSVQTPKTATEANIQQTGFQTRTGSMQDLLDDVLTEFALYTAEVALWNMSVEDAQAIAGPSAFWLPSISPADLKSLVDVRIKAGSSGKPNIAQDRQVWAQIYPLLTNDIQVIAKLRNSDPEEIASRIEELVRQTFTYAGMAGSTDRFIPRSGAQPAGPPPISPVEQSEIHLNDCMAMFNVANAIKAVPAMAMQPKLGDPDAPPPDVNGPVGVLVKEMMSNQAAGANKKLSEANDMQPNATKLAVAHVQAASSEKNAAVNALAGVAKAKVGARAKAASDASKAASAAAKPKGNSSG